MMYGASRPFRNAATSIAAVGLLTLFLAAITLYLYSDRADPVHAPDPLVPATAVWKAPDIARVRGDSGDLIRYGRELVAHTARYLGPSGSISRRTNGMNCQNCHLVAGTRPFGNNYALVASTYPRFRARSGTVESIEKRINDCIERSLNGRKLDENSEELRAIKAYILWVGGAIDSSFTPRGVGLGELSPMDRAADPERGRSVFLFHCARCHGENARGRRLGESVEWTYPPLAGDSSYNTGAGLFRLSRFATYVRYNMPEGTTYDRPVLSEEEAWDVAAYVNSLPRPVGDFPADWPEIETKPFDHPFGPFADTFPQHQHKYGPFKPIRDYHASRH